MLQSKWFYKFNNLYFYIGEICARLRGEHQGHPDSLMQNVVMKRVYLASKMLLTDLEEKSLQRTCFEVTEHGGLPIAPALYVSRFLDHDSDSARIMQVSIGLLEMCEELWLIGDPIHFTLEVGAASRLGLVVRQLEPDESLTNDLLHYASN